MNSWKIVSGTLASVVSALILVPVVDVSGQANYQPALAITRQGDTLHGFINHKEWTKNPRIFEFKQSPGDGVAQHLGAKQIRYVKVEEDEFVLYTGPVSMDENSIRLNDAPEYQSQIDTLFLNVVATGQYVELSQYRDKIKTRFFLSVEGHKPEELTYRYFMAQRNGRTGLRSITKYRNQLMTAATVTNTLTDDLKIRIKKAAYSQGTLVHIVDRINNKKTVASKGAAIFHLGAGANLTRMVYSPPTLPASSSPARPYFTLGFDFYGNRNVQKLAVRTELSIGYAQIDALPAKQSTIGLSAQVLYHIYNQKNFKFYLAPGVRINHSTYSDTHNNDFGFFPLYYCYVIQGGLLINRRIDVSCSYSAQLFGSISDLANTPAFNVTRVGINYHFVK